VSPRAAGNSSNFAGTNAAQKYDEIMPENNSCDYSNVQQQPQQSPLPIGTTSTGSGFEAVKAIMVFTLCCPDGV